MKRRAPGSREKPLDLARERSIEAGDTLIELLVAVTIIGIAAAGILSGLIAAIGSSGTHRSLTSLDAIVKSFAETAKYDIQQRPVSVGGPMFTQCAASAQSYVVASAPYPPSGPVNTAVTVFGSGFTGTGTPTPSLTPGPTPVTTFSGQVSGGDLTSTFNVPALPAGAQTITITDGNSAPAAATFTVTPLVQLNHSSGPVGTSVNLTLTGFAKFSLLTAKLASTTVATGMSTSTGSLGLSFNVPSVGLGSQTLTVTDPSNDTATFTFTVTAVGTPPGTASTNGPIAASPLAQFQVGLSGIQYWNVSGFTPSMTACQSDPNRSDQLQQLTVSASAPGATDQLNFVVANPTYVLPPTTVTVLASPTPATTGNTLTFTAAVGPVGIPAPTGTVTWTIPAPSGAPVCAPSNLTAGTPTCVISNALSGNYTVSAAYSGDGRYGASSGSTTITVFPPTKLAFTAQPGGGGSGAVWASQPAITVEDAAGDPATSSSASVTLAIASQPGSGATLTCTGGLTQAASSGVASFTGCQIVGKAGAYTLTATSAGLTSTTSSSFNITVGAATQLVFTAQPGGGANNVAWTNQPAVTIQDSGGNTVNSNANITLAIASQPGSGAVLTCTGGLTQAASSGVASFTGCQIVGKAGAYTLTATSAGLTSTTSSSFNITVGAATQLVFTAQPGGGANNVAWTNQPAVTIQDSGGNTVNSNANITLAIASQPGSGAVLTCTGGLTQAASSGVASFTGCQIVGKAGAYTLTATSAGLTSTTSSSFNITVGAATQLVFTAQPGGGANNVAWTNQPAVTIQDSGGNTVNSNANITLAIASQPGSGAVLTCTGGLTQAASSGVASFTGCQIVGKAGAYTLTATSAGLTSTTSSSFNITVGAATQLVFTVQPGGGVHGVAWTNQPVVNIEDSGGNTVNSNANITLAINTGSGALSCTTNPKAAVAGVAMFAGCKISVAGNDTLKATAAGLATAISMTVVDT